MPHGDRAIVSLALDGSESSDESEAQEDSNAPHQADAPHQGGEFLGYLAFGVVAYISLYYLVAAWIASVFEDFLVHDATSLAIDNVAGSVNPAESSAGLDIMTAGYAATVRAVAAASLIGSEPEPEPESALEPEPEPEDEAASGAPNAEPAPAPEPAPEDEAAGGAPNAEPAADAASEEEPAAADTAAAARTAEEAGSAPNAPEPAADAASEEEPAAVDTASAARTAEEAGSAPNAPESAAEPEEDRRCNPFACISSLLKHCSLFKCCRRDDADEPLSEMLLAVDRSGDEASTL